MWNFYRNRLKFCTHLDDSTCFENCLTAIYIFVTYIVWCANVIRFWKRWINFNSSTFFWHIFCARKLDFCETQKKNLVFNKLLICRIWVRHCYSPYSLWLPQQHLQLYEWLNTSRMVNPFKFFGFVCIVENMMVYVKFVGNRFSRSTGFFQMAIFPLSNKLRFLNQIIQFLICGLLNVFWLFYWQKYSYDYFWV